MPLRRLSANEAKPTFALPNPNVGKLVQLRNRIGIAADFAIEGIVQLSGRITANPGSSPKIGLCPDWPTTRPRSEPQCDNRWKTERGMKPMRLLLVSSIVVSLCTSIGALLLMRMVPQSLRLRIGPLVLPINVLSSWSLLLIGTGFVVIAFLIFVVSIRAVLP